MDIGAARGNNLDAVRLLAALTVMASHAYVLTGHSNDEPLARLMAHTVDGGALAVGVFFILSGFLIARSAQRRTTRDYATARFRRIYPGFATVVLLQALLLGPLATSLPTRAYFAEPSLWTGLFRALAFSPPAGLPGVFDGNALPGIVNGSLWTLRIEVLCYAGLLALARLGLLCRGRVLVPLAAAWALLALVTLAGADLRWTAIVDCLLHFMMGAAAWVFLDRLRWRPVLAGLALVLIVALARTPLAPVSLHLLLPYLVLWLGLATPPLPRFGDVSYGVYLYAFPIAQLLCATTGLGPTGLILFGMPPTLLCAILSRWLVERPALRAVPVTPAPGCSLSGPRA